MSISLTSAPHTLSTDGAQTLETIAQQQQQNWPYRRRRPPRSSPANPAAPLHCRGRRSYRFCSATASFRCQVVFPRSLASLTPLQRSTSSSAAAGLSCCLHFRLTPAHRGLFPLFLYSRRPLAISQSLRGESYRCHPFPPSLMLLPYTPRPPANHALLMKDTDPEKTGKPLAAQTTGAVAM